MSRNIAHNFGVQYATVGFRRLGAATPAYAKRGASHKRERENPWPDPRPTAGRDRERGGLHGDLGVAV